MDINFITAALVEAINAPTRPPALRSLAYIKYPTRELQPQVNSEGSLAVSLALYGWEYKHKGPRPKIPPNIDTVAVQTVLNSALPDGLTVIAVQDYGKYLKIIVQGGKAP